MVFLSLHGIQIMLKLIFFTYEGFHKLLRHLLLTLVYEDPSISILYFAFCMYIVM